MTKVRQLTLEQKNILVGKVWGYNGQLFNPQLDANGVWFISNEEVNGCTLQQAQLIGCDAWLLTLPEIDYNPAVIQFPIEKKQFTLETSYFIEPDLQATVCLRPSDPEISDYLASNFTFPNEQAALDEIYELAITQRPILFEMFQAMDNVPIEVRDTYFL
jgi:hypothetical protein